MSDIKYPSGTRVIVRSNENESLWVGFLIRYDNFNGKALKPFPVVEKPNQAEYIEFICMGAVVEYSDELYKHLLSLTNKQQYDYLTKD